MLRTALNKEEHYNIDDCSHILTNNFKIQSDVLLKNSTYINNPLKSQIFSIIQTMEYEENYLHKTDSIINMHGKSYNYLKQNNKKFIINYKKK